MMDVVYFERANGQIINPRAEYGILLKSFYAPPPTPKLYRVNLDGRDGDLDMSEWAGALKYNDRAVEIEMRDMNGNADSLVQAILGEKLKIWHSSDTEYYYEGRCDSIDKSTQRHVTDLDIEFTCSPWRLKKDATVIPSQHITSTPINVFLQTSGKPVVPMLALTAQCSLTWHNSTHILGAGEHKPSWLVISNTLERLTVTGSGVLSIYWKDGKL